MNSYEFMVGTELVETLVETRPDGFLVRVGQHNYEVTRLMGGQLRLTSSEGKVVVVAVKSEDKYFVDIGGTVIELRERAEDSFSGMALDHDVEKDKVFAPMPGKIVKIHVRVGDDVVKKQILAVVEAMKMENPVQALASGKVKSVNFSEGDQVDTEQAIIELDLDN